MAVSNDFNRMRQFIAFLIGTFLSVLLVSSHAAPAAATLGARLQAPTPLAVSQTHRDGSTTMEPMQAREAEEAAHSHRSGPAESEPRWAWWLVGLVCVGLLANGRRNS